MKSGLTIYLAGPITGLSYEECTSWRLIMREVLEPLGFKIFDPMIGKEHLKGKKRIEKAYKDDIIANAKTIVAFDFFRVKISDILLVNFLHAKHISIGTVSEIGFAKGKDENKIIITIMDDKNCHYHPFVTENSIVVKTEEEAIMLLKILALELKEQGKLFENLEIAAKRELNEK